MWTLRHTPKIISSLRVSLATARQPITPEECKHLFVTFHSIKGYDWYSERKYMGQITLVAKKKSAELALGGGGGGGGES